MAVKTISNYGQRRVKVTYKHPSLAGQRRKGNTTVFSISVPNDIALWLRRQVQNEGRTVSYIASRALDFERERVEDLGSDPTRDELDFGRV